MKQTDMDTDNFSNTSNFIQNKSEILFVFLNSIVEKKVEFI